jgi:hypothetical protein
VDDLTAFCCQNPDCADHGRRGAGNLTVCMRYGRGGRLRLLYCRTCKNRFSERKGTPLFGLALPDDKIAGVLNHLSEGCGVRQTGRLVGVHRDTVMRLARRAGRHAKAAHDELVAVSPSDQRTPVRREVEPGPRTG